MVLRRANPLLVTLEGVGPENLDFFGPTGLSLRCSHFRAKKVSIPGPTPSNAPRNDGTRFARSYFRTRKVSISRAQGSPPSPTLLTET